MAAVKMIEIKVITVGNPAVGGKLEPGDTLIVDDDIGRYMQVDYDGGTVTVRIVRETVEGPL